MVGLCWWLDYVYASSWCIHSDSNIQPGRASLFFSFFGNKQDLALDDARAQKSSKSSVEDLTLSIVHT